MGLWLWGGRSPGRGPEQGRWWSEPSRAFGRGCQRPGKDCPAHRSLLGRGVQSPPPHLPLKPLCSGRMSQGRLCWEVACLLWAPGAWGGWAGPSTSRQVEEDGFRVGLSSGGWVRGNAGAFWLPWDRLEATWDGRISGSGGGLGHPMPGGGSMPGPSGSVCGFLCVSLGPQGCVATSWLSCR